MNYSLTMWIGSAESHLSHQRCRDEEVWSLIVGLASTVFDTPNAVKLELDTKEHAKGLVGDIFRFKTTYQNPLRVEIVCDYKCMAKLNTPTDP